MKKPLKHTTKNQIFANLEKYQSIDVEEDWSIVKNKIGFAKSRRMPALWQVAAAVILMLSVGYLLQQYIIGPPSVIVASTGEELKELLLPDGTRVFLNKHSELTYPEKFRKINRKVKLSGEGFFMVTPNPSKAFLVNIADRATVEVLGTSFNIFAPVDSESLGVQVVDGKVAFYANENPELTKILIKDDQAQLRNGEIILNSLIDRNFLSWKTGVLYFEQEEISKVVEILSRHYEKELVLDNSVDIHLMFTSTIDNQELESVLEELNIVLGLKYTLVDQKILIHNNE